MARFSLLILLSSLGLFGCQTPDPVSEGEMLAVNVSEQAVQSARDITISQFGSVCWFNGGQLGQEFHVVIERSMGDSLPCSTTVGFAQQGAEARTRSRVGLQDCVVICFHHPGEFPYRVEGDGFSLKGVVRVREIAR